MNGIMITQKEEWRDVVGYEGLYKVSDQGRVYSVRYKREMTPYLSKHGYLQVILCNGGEHKIKMVHRLVVEAFRGPIPEGMEINHLSQARSDNRLSNLEICTRRANCAHANCQALKHLKDEELTPQQLEYRIARREAQSLNPEKYKATAKAWYEAHRDELRAKGREYAKNHREESNERHKKWRAANLEKVRARERERYAENLEESRAKDRAWYAANKEHITARKRAYNAARLAAMSEEELKAYRAKQAAYGREYRARKKAEKLAKNQNLNLDTP